MIFLVTALKLEAEPLISFFSLKKDSNTSAFSLYSNENIKLIISGTGKIRAALAAGFLLSGCNKNDLSNVLLVNIGICGSSDNRTGDLFSVHKVHDADSKRDYYPEIFPWLKSKNQIVKHSESVSFSQSREITCVSTPAGESNRNLSNDKMLFDMESSGIMEAAAKFLESQQVLLLKVVSDLLSPETVTPAAIRTLITNKQSEIEAYITNAYKQVHLLPKTPQIPSELAKISANLNFTVSMQYTLEKDIRYCFASNHDAKKILADFPIYEVKNKKEAKEAFEKLHAKLRTR